MQAGAQDRAVTKRNAFCALMELCLLLFKSLPKAFRSDCEAQDLSWQTVKSVLILPFILVSLHPHVIFMTILCEKRQQREKIKHWGFVVRLAGV